MMTWNDELCGRLEVINARLTRLETLPTLDYQHNHLDPAKYPTAAVPPASGTGVKVADPAYAVN